MADDVFNITKGRVNQYVDDVANNNPASASLVIVAQQAYCLPRPSARALF